MKYFFSRVRNKGYFEIKCDYPLQTSQVLEHRNVFMKSCIIFPHALDYNDIHHDNKKITRR